MTIVWCAHQEHDALSEVQLAVADTGFLFEIVKSASRFGRHALQASLICLPRKFIAYMLNQTRQGNA